MKQGIAAQRPFSFAIVILLLLCTSACSTGIPAPELIEPNIDQQSPTTITFAAPEQHRKAYESIITSFNASHPTINVQFVGLQTNLYAPQSASDLQILVQSADTSAVAEMPAGIESASTYLQDLTPYSLADRSFRGDELLSLISPEQLRYLVPAQVTLPLWSYNPTLWQQAGLSKPSSLESWFDMRVGLENLVQVQGRQSPIYGVADESDGHMLLAYVYLEQQRASNGVSPSTNSQPTSITNALTELSTLIDNKVVYVAPDPQNATTIELIRTQRLALWPAWLTTSTTLPFPVNYVAFTPADVPGFRPVISGYIMSASTAHPQQAWTWLAYLSQQAVQLPNADRCPVVVAARPLLQIPQLCEPLTTPWGQQLLATPPIPLLSTRERVDMTVLSQAWQLLRTERVTPQQALTLAQATLASTPEAALSNQDPTRPLPVATAVPTVARSVTRVQFSYGGGQPPAALMTVADQFNTLNPTTRIDIVDSTLADQADCSVSWVAPTRDALQKRLDLKPLLDIDSQIKLDDFSPATIQPLYQEGYLYGLPLSVKPRMLAYNPTLFDHAGLPYPTVSWTMDDLVATAQKLTDEQSDQYGFGTIGQSDINDVTYILGYYGAQVTQGVGNNRLPTYTDEQVIKAAQTFVALRKAVLKNPLLRAYGTQTSDSQTSDAVLQKRVGMWLEFGQTLPAFLRLQGGQIDDTTYRLAPIPLGSQGFSADDILLRVFTIAPTTQNASICWEWYRFLSERPSVNPQGDLPGRLSISRSDSFRSTLSDDLRTVYDHYTNKLDTSTSLIQGTESLWSTTFTSKMNYYWFYQALDQMLQGRPAQEALDEAQETTLQYLFCVRSGAAEEGCGYQVDPTYQGS